jgi:hypothetical protein
MSNWSAALELGGLDIDSAFRDTIFAQLREGFGRMVRSPITLWRQSWMLTAAVLQNSSMSPAMSLQHAFERRVADVKAPKR